VFGLLAGIGWLTFLSPTLGYDLFPYVAAFGLLGAAIQIFWLLVFGVNEERWKEQAARRDRERFHAECAERRRTALLRLSAYSA
jgi:hypothetical protein